MKVLSCHHCGKHFRHMSQLMQHSLVHNDDRTLACGVCKKRFRDQYGLDQHSKIHNVHKPYVCDKCGKRFRQQISLNQHVESTGHTQGQYWDSTPVYTSFESEYNHKELREHVDEYISPQTVKEEPIVASSSFSDAQSTEMTSIDSLQIIDSYMEKEPIESDEESLHLLLEADDDPPKNSGGETEDDILNKFEADAAGNEAAAIDENIEEHLLNEDHDNVADTNEEKQDAAESKELEDTAQTETEASKESEMETENLRESEMETEDLEESEMKTNKGKDDISEENKENHEHLVNGDIEEKLMKDVDSKSFESADDCIRKEDFDVEEDKLEENETEKEEVIVERNSISEEEETTDNNEVNKEDLSENKNNRNTEDLIENSIDDRTEHEIKKESEMETESLKDDEDKVEENDENNTEKNYLHNDEDNLETAEKDAENIEELSDNQVRSEEGDKVEESDSKSETVTISKEKESDEEIEKESEDELKINDLKSPEESKILTKDKITADKQNEVPEDKCDNSNDSSKCNNLDSEDLLDISIIRDTEDDDASAIAEIQADAKEAQEKAENEDQESGSDRNDAEDEMDIDKETDQMEIDDTVEHLEADLETEKDSSEISTIAKESINLENSELDATDKETVQDNLKETESINKADDDLENATELPVSSKRQIDDENESPSAKKPKLDNASEQILQMAQKEVLKSLKQFSSFMKDRKFSDKLTRSDLEQFVMQKICEVIMHKTAAGDMHLTIRKHEQTIDSLRKDVVQLSKQCRDLEIVNKKLLNELKAQSSVGNKPLVPLKITRSVGLQVKLGVNIDNKRRLLTAVPSSLSKTGVVQITSPQKSPRASPNILKQTTPIAKQPVTVKAPSVTTNAAPLLTQALQTKKTPSPIVAKRTTPTATTTPMRPVKINTPSSSVIDLTAEDDKIAKTSSPSIGGAFKTIALNSVKTIPLKTTGIKPGTTLPAGIRVTPGKNGSITLPAGVMTSTPLMYVVQPSALSQGLVTTTAGSGQKVFLNLQPTNGVLTSSLNGSAVSVFQKPANSSPTMKRKHPAPLPIAPVYRNDTNLKPIPPKPHLTIRKTDNGIILQWKMPYNLEMYETIASYQLYAYQETPSPPNTEMWRRVGDVKALALPMACTLTQFADKNRYYFAVRSVDVHKRIGPFSEPEEISL